MRKIIAQVGKHITDCMDVKLGLKAMDETRPEYWMLNEILTDEMVELILKMKGRKPYSPIHQKSLLPGYTGASAKPKIIRPVEV